MVVMGMGQTESNADPSILDGVAFSSGVSQQDFTGEQSSRNDLHPKLLTLLREQNTKFPRR